MYYLTLLTVIAVAVVAIVIYAYTADDWTDI